MRKNFHRFFPSATPSNLARAGVTFIELVVYVAIIGIVMSTMIPFITNMMSSGAKSTTEQEVSSQARYLTERIKQEIRAATAINTSDFGSNLASNTALQLSLTHPTNGTTLIKVTSAGLVTITQGAGSPIALNSNDTKVTSLIFTNYTSGDSKSKHVAFTMTMQSDYTGTQTEYQESMDLRGSAELRSN